MIRKVEEKIKEYRNELAKDTESSAERLKKI